MVFAQLNLVSALSIVIFSAETKSTPDVAAKFSNRKKFRFNLEQFPHSETVTFFSPTRSAETLSLPLLKCPQTTLKYKLTTIDLLEDTFFSCFVFVIGPSEPYFIFVLPPPSCQLRKQITFGQMENFIIRLYVSRNVLSGYCFMCRLKNGNIIRMVSHNCDEISLVEKFEFKSIKMLHG